jgi:hypothetical protein
MENSMSEARRKGIKAELDLNRNQEDEVRLRWAKVLHLGSYTAPRIRKWTILNAHGF